MILDEIAACTRLRMEEQKQSQPDIIYIAVDEIVGEKEKRDEQRKGKYQRSVHFAS